MAKASADSLSVAKANILVVDDHPSNLLAIRAVLEELGHNLIEANSGREALQLLHEYEFALALIDVNMPTLDGFQTAVLIRKQSRSRHLPIIFMTAYGAEELSTAK